MCVFLELLDARRCKAVDCRKCTTFNSLPPMTSACLTRHGSKKPLSNRTVSYSAKLLQTPHMGSAKEKEEIFTLL